MTTQTTSGSTASSTSISKDSSRGSGTGTALATAAPSALQTSEGNTTIADGVVSKIAGLSAREVSGVYELGGGAARTMGALRDRIPGASSSRSQGVSVEVGETEAAVDIDLVAEYGVSIADLAKSVRRNVISSVEGMTGLHVVEVNISVNDIHLPSDDTDDRDKQPEPARVQ